MGEFCSDLLFFTTLLIDFGEMFDLGEIDTSSISRFVLCLHVGRLHKMHRCAFDIYHLLWAGQLRMLWGMNMIA